MSKYYIFKKEKIINKFKAKFLRESCEIHNITMQTFDYFMRREKERKRIFKRIPIF